MVVVVVVVLVVVVEVVEVVVLLVVVVVVLVVDVYKRQDTSNNIDLEDSINLFLTSMALVQLGIAHLINAEAEKIQHVLEMLQDQTSPEIQPTIDDLLKINRSVDQILRNVIKNEMLLQFKLEETLTISTTTTSTTTTTTSSTTTSTTSTTTTSTTTTTRCV